MQPKLTKKGNDMSNTTTGKIADLNDLCRTAMGIAGRLFQTAGISALSLADQSAIREMESPCRGGSRRRKRLDRRHSIVDEQFQFALKKGAKSRTYGKSGVGARQDRNMRLNLFL